MVRPFPVKRSSASSLSGVESTCEPSFCIAASLIMCPLARSKSRAHLPHTSSQSLFPGAFARISFCRSSGSAARAIYSSLAAREQTGHALSPAARSDSVCVLGNERDSCGVIVGFQVFHIQQLKSIRRYCPRKTRNTLNKIVGISILESRVEIQNHFRVFSVFRASLLMPCKKIH